MPNDTLDVTVFGDAPFTGARRLIGLTEQGPVYGPPEQKGQIQPDAPHQCACGRLWYGTPASRCPMCRHAAALVEGVLRHG